VLLVLVLGAFGCNSRMPVLNPDPRTFGEYAEDRDVCVRKHSFAQTGAPSGTCLHCELFALCMESRMWQMEPFVPPDSAVTCCRGTEKPTSGARPSPA
jgi:hypothetical protein